MEVATHADALRLELWSDSWTEAGDSGSVFSNWSIEGATPDNTNQGVLEFQGAAPDTLYTVNLVHPVTRAVVATGSVNHAAGGTVTLSSAVGLSGSVDVVAAAADVSGTENTLTVQPTDVESLSVARTLPGVAILAVAARNGPGTGMLLWSGSALRWKAPGSTTAGTPVVIASDGTYLLEDGDDPDKFIRVTTYSDYMPTSEASATVYLRDVFGNGVSHDDVTGAEAEAGTDETYAVMLRNDSNVGLSNVKAWLEDTGYSIGLVGQYKHWLSGDNSSWSQPTTEGTAIELDDIPAGEAGVLYVKRDLYALLGNYPDVLQHLHFSYDGV